MTDDILSNVWPEWRIVKVIGKGSYGIVYKAERTDTSVKSNAAIKVISIPQTETELASLMAEGMTAENAREYYRSMVDDFISEIMIMESLKGVQNIVSVEDYKVVEKPGRIGWDIYIRMELLTSFNDYLLSHRMSERDIIDLGIDICTALERCAKLNIIHRDVKPENIFINNFGDFKLGDFGIARRLENTSFGMSIKGTYNYMAPEIERGEEYDSTVDTYSLGLVLYRLANDNRLPFLTAADQSSANARAMAVKRRLSGDPFPAPCNASFELAQIIDIACQPDPRERFGSATAMKNALRSLKSDMESHKIPVMSMPPMAAIVGDPDSMSIALNISDPNRTVSVRKAGGAQSMQTGGANYLDGTTRVNPPPEDPNDKGGKKDGPPERSGAARVIIPVAIAAAVTVLLAVLAIILLPRLLDADNGNNKKENKTTSATQSSLASVQQTTTQPQTPVPETTAVPETTTPETTTQPPRQYTVGEIITFGHYEQDANTANGKEEIEWIVLDVQEESILVISRRGLDGQQYDSSGRDLVTWETCTLRNWLNSSFLNNAFSAEEQEKILLSLVPADRNAEHKDKDPGNATWDKVFLLSTNEASYYFSSDKYRIMEPTSYAKAMGVTYCNNEHDQGYGYWWWLRTPGDTRKDDVGKVFNAAALVYPEGKIDYKGSYYFDTENAVRPAMWIAR